LVPIKSLDELELIATLLSDIQTSHSEVYSPRAMRLDQRKLARRVEREGISFLTKALPRLDKALLRALTGEVSFDSTGFRKETGSQLPIFMGGLFRRIFSHDGWVLPTPCVDCIEAVRQILTSLGKYELPYEQDQEQEVLEKFERTELEVLDLNLRFQHLARSVDSSVPLGRQVFDFGEHGHIITKARKSLARLFASFDERDITPSHGPGAVSTKEKLWEKWTFSVVSPRIADSYPIDAYYYASPGHICDDFQSFRGLKYVENPAKVVLVPKDSRGPRLISCEPLEFQWIQQGLMRAIVKHVENHAFWDRRKTKPGVKWNIHFTDQQPNQFGALLGSKTGRYATLDLNEASDRVSCGLVQLLFPEPILSTLLNCRSLSTRLPGGKELILHKYAPMGSALCFPVLALTIWSLLDAGAPDADTREGILVYGDDIVVPAAYAANAMKILEAFGLKINQAKSFVQGFFRESCGVDAYKGVDVTPVRFRTVWKSSQCPHVYASWISYANSLLAKRYRKSYELIARRLISVYGEIPLLEDFPQKEVPVLYERPETIMAKLPIRSNKAQQRLERKVWTIKPVTLTREIDGWKMLLRYFTEGQKPASPLRHSMSRRSTTPMGDLIKWLSQENHESPFSVRQYTRRNTIKLVKRWR